MSIGDWDEGTLARFIEATMDQSRLGVLAQATGEPWHILGAAGEPALLNGWVQFGDLRLARFRRVGGMTQMAGLVKNGTNGLSVCTLPPGFRPQPQYADAAAGNVHIFPAQAAGGVVQLAFYGVNPGAPGNAGAVLPTNVGAAVGATFLSFDGIFFLHE